MRAQSGLEWSRDRRRFRADPELVVDALHQSPAGSELPGKLREDLVLLVGPGESRIRPWLTIVVAQVLVTGKEPQAIAKDRTAHVCREITVPGAFVAAFQLTRT